MLSESLAGFPASIEAAPPPRSLGRLTRAVPALAALTLLALLTMLRPVGYHGGGWDDWHYLEAARCAVRNGLCVPTSHWWTRWPLLAPVSALLWLFGESRQNLWVVPAFYAAAATILFATLIQRQFGSRAALIASLAFVATPIFNERVLDLNVDVPELTWVLASLLALQCAIRTGARASAAVAGGLLVLAICSRPTAIVFVPILTLALMFNSPTRRLAGAFAGAVGAALAVEAAGYWLWTGRPLLAWQLSLKHTSIPSSELAPGVDLGQSPLFSLAYIRGWNPASGIKLFWAVDPVLNLLAHPAIGFVLLLAALMVAFGQRELPRTTRLVVMLLASAAVLHFGALVYALAIDPKPRMFLFEVAIAAAMIGAVGAQSRKPLFALVAAAGIAILGARSVIAQLEAPDADLPRLGLVADRWLIETGKRVTTTAFTRSILALVPAVERLPLYDPNSAKLDVLLVAPDHCSPSDSALGRGWWRVGREYSVPQTDFTPVVWLRRHNFLSPPREHISLCLMQRQER